MVLIKKVNADTQGTGNMEVFWKMSEAVIDTRILKSSLISRFLAWVLRREGYGNRNHGDKTSTIVGKCVIGSTITSINLRKEGVRQPRPGETTTTSRILGGTKTMGIKNIILVKTGSSHSLERLPWTSVPINHRDITWGTGLTNALQCVSLKCVASLDITHSGG